jgi:hypothetical protein
MTTRIIVTLQVIGIALLALCVIGNALLGYWGNAGLAVGAAILLIRS